MNQRGGSEAYLHNMGRYSAYHSGFRQLIAGKGWTKWKDEVLWGLSNTRVASDTSDIPTMHGVQPYSISRQRASNRGGIHAGVVFIHTLLGALHGLGTDCMTVGANIERQARHSI